METRLVWSQQGQEHSHTLGPEPITIGRAPENAIVIADQRVSRVHARLEWSHGGLRFSDLGSQNGTLLNGRRNGGGALTSGDILTIGRVALRVQSEDAPARPEGSPCTETIPVLAASASDLASELAELSVRILDTDFFARAVQAALRITRAERGFLLAHHKGGLSVEASTSISAAEMKDPDFELSWSIATQVATRQAPVLALDAGLDPRFRGQASVETLCLRSVLAVPVANLGRTLGALYVDHRSQANLFGPEQQRELECLASALGGFWRTRLLQEELGLRPKAGTVAADRTIELRESDFEAEREIVLVGNSARMDELRHLIGKVAPTELPVLITGESGTGKELVARLVHRASRRSRRAFHSLNCAAIPETLLESELFGHVRGAFTGADESKKGLFLAADGGTLFLDEVSEMSPAMQSRLLRVLQEGEIRPVGSTDMKRVDVRLIAASNKDLATLVSRGEFREDLYFRLRVLPVQVPPLRDRKEDLPALLSWFLRAHGGAEPPRLTPEAMETLTAYRWPGNVRELENEVKRLCVLAGSVIGREALSGSILEAQELLVGKDSGFQDLDALIEAIETKEIRKALVKAEGNKTRAADLLGITRFTLQRKMDRYGLDADSV